jgi:hypothetical protein
LNDEHETRLWLGGVEVQFIKWTPNGLIYNRVGSLETVAHLSKSTIHRLLDEGTLYIEGYRPDWAYPEADED